MEDKGMYKLKYFCQVCNRQCNDRDGFNCHLNSATHKRNIERVAQNPDEYINKYSKEFEFGFVDVLKRTSNHEWISANKVYQEYISDREAMHLNATRWESLSAFIRYLEGQGRCLVLSKETDTMIKYLDDSPNVVQSRKLFEKKIKLKEVEAKHKEKQVIKYANKEQIITDKTTEQSYHVNVEDFKSVAIELKPKKQVTLPKIEKFLGNKRKESSRKELSSKDNDEDKWLSEDLIVRIKDMNLSRGKFYNKKGVIKHVHQDYIAEIETEGTRLKIDQELLEPVIPQVESYVKIIRSPYKAKVGLLIDLDLKDKHCTLKLSPDHEVIKTDLFKICKFNKSI